MKNEELTKKLLSPSKNSRLEKFGRYLTFACLSLIVVIVAMILIFVAQKGLSTFFVNGVNVFDFLFGGVWNPSGKEFGALPMILGSFIVTILSALIATPFAIGAAVFMTEVSPKGAKILQRNALADHLAGNTQGCSLRYLYSCGLWNGTCLW